jgi:flagellar hook-length control protein FliK
MLRQVSIHHVGHQTTLQMELEAPRLARVGLSLKLEGGQVVARFSSADPAGLGILQAAAPELQASLADRGLKLAQVEFASHGQGMDPEASKGGAPSQQGGREDGREPRGPRKAGGGRCVPRGAGVGARGGGRSTDYLA